MKKYCIIFSLAICTSFFCCVALTAQIGNFKNGYIIANQGDTIFGMVDLRTNAVNQQQCRFLPNGTQKATVYSPKDIKSYFFIDDGKYYLSKNIEIEGADTTVFVEFLVKGMMNLYYYEYRPASMPKKQYYRDNGYIPYYFFENEKGEMLHIKQDPEYKAANEMYLKHDNKYKGQIKYAFRNIKPIADNADKLPFNQKTFIKVTQQYHNAVCTTGEECIVFQTHKPDQTGIVFKIAPYIGVQKSNYFYHNSLYNFADNREYEYSKQYNIAPQIGAELSVINPRWTNMLALQIDLSLSSFSYPNDTLLIIKTQQPPIHKVYERKIEKYNALAPVLHIGFQFIYPKFKVKPAVGAGFAYMHLFGNDDIKEKHYGFYTFVGLNFQLSDNHALILRCNYENFPPGDKMQGYGDDYSKTLSLKAGYQF